MFEFIRYSFIFFIFGFFPLLLLFRFVNFSIKKSLLFSVGFSQVAIAIFNIIAVLLNIQHSNIIYLFLGLVYLIIGFFYWKTKKIFIKSSSDEYREAGILIAFGLLFGCFYWLHNFYEVISYKKLYSDVLFNLSIIGELKNHFPPIDPNWYTGKVFFYHYLTNIYFAGVSNFSNITILNTAITIGSFITTISIFVIISLFCEIKNAIQSLVIIIILLTFHASNDWVLLNSFWGHTTGYGASTYYWSLPILFSSIFLWIDFDNWRSSIIEKDAADIKFHFKSALLLLLLTVVIIFSKGSHITIFIFLEFFSLLSQYIFTNKKLFLKINIKNILSYVYVPLFTIIIYMFLLNGEGTSLIPGIEDRDFLPFKSWNPIYPIIAVYGFIIIFFIINFKSLIKQYMAFIFVSLMNFILVFIVKHEGFSDVYFGFNAFICNIIFFISIKDDYKLPKLFLSVVILTVFIFIGIQSFNIKGFTTSFFSRKNADYVNLIKTNFLPIEDNYSNDLTLFKNYLPQNSLIAVPYTNYKDYRFASIMERRIWNASNAYAHTTQNEEYTSIRFVMKSEGFIPYYIERRPSAGARDSVLIKTVKTKEYQEYISQLEDPNIRYKIYDECVFNSNSIEKSENIARSHGWTHFIVLNDKIHKINNWAKTKKKIQGKELTIYFID